MPAGRNGGTGPHRRGTRSGLDSIGHCDFSPAELIAGVLALSHRVTTGHWDQMADPSSLNQVAVGLDLGPARFAGHYYPGPLTGATGLNLRQAGASTAPLSESMKEYAFPTGEPGRS